MGLVQSQSVIQIQEPWSAQIVSSPADDTDFSDWLITSDPTYPGSFDPFTTTAWTPGGAYFGMFTAGNTDPSPDGYEWTLERPFQVISF